MAIDEIEARENPTATVQVWDTQYVPSCKAFGVFREAICTSFMPWTPELKPDTNFAGRVESVLFEQGSIGRVRMSPIVASRTKSNIAHSPLDCIYGNFVLSGGLTVEQDGRTNIAKPGDLAVYDSEMPVTLTLKPGMPYEDISLAIPKILLKAVDKADNYMRNILLTRGQMIDPLSSCLAFIAEHIHSSSAEEMSALFESLISLLLLGAGCFEGQKIKGPVLKGNHLLREILDFINRNILDADLSPGHAAEHANVSTRYVHKLFARSGTTFSSYVVAKRLDRIRLELVAPACRQHPISELAYRWGFNDLSTFNRAFKQRFGCTPSQFRVQVGR